jgi:hypothetical protein
MDDFPDFMKRAANRIATSSQETPGVEGFVFDRADGSQMAFWICGESAVSAPHAHDFDEYMVVVQRCYTLIIEGKRIPVQAGEVDRALRGRFANSKTTATTQSEFKGKFRYVRLKCRRPRQSQTLKARRTASMEGACGAART